jgi:integrase
VKRNGLTALGVRRLTKPGRYADGGGLYLAISPNGAKSWVFMWKRGGIRKAAGRGSVHTVPLAEAREIAADDRKIVREGGDPPKARARTASMPTFGECADAYIASNEAAWSNAKHRYQVELQLNRYAAPLRSLPVDQIDTAQVLAVLQPLWQSKTDTAKRLRQRIEAVIDAARARGHRSGENPARWRGHLDKILPSPERLARVEHHPAMPYTDVPVFMAKLRATEGIAARALEVTILTAARVGEVRGATWSEIDMNNRLWVIPPGRMKAGNEHRVPLSDRAMTILREMEKLRLSDFVFPGFRDNRPLSDVTVRAVLHGLGVTDAVTHGFRSSFRDWAGDETSAPHDVIEAALAHAIKNRTEAAYRRGTALEKRRALMQTWASYCNGADNVMPIRQRGAL